MKHILLTMWCLPQYILFLIMRKILKAQLHTVYRSRRIWVFDSKKYPHISGVALFHTLLPDTQKDNQLTIAHEHGHHLQGNKWGWLYLLVIGIPSVITNLRARKNQRISENYYLLYPEKQADRLSGITWEHGKRIHKGGRI